MADIPLHDEQGTYDRPHKLTVTFDPLKIDALLAEFGDKPWRGERPVVVPVLLVHGTADEVVPFFRLEAARSALRSAGIPVDTLVRPNLGHSVDDEGVMAAACLLHRCLGQG